MQFAHCVSCANATAYQARSAWERIVFFRQAWRSMLLEQIRLTARHSIGSRRSRTRMMCFQSPFPCSSSTCGNLSGKETRGLDDLADIEVSGFGRLGEIHSGMGLPLFVQKLLQDGFGIDPHEFFAKNSIEEIDVRRMDAKAVVDHREMMDALGFEPVNCQHHVCGVHRMDEVSDNAVNLLPRVDLPFFILFIHDEGVVIVACLTT